MTNLNLGTALSGISRDHLGKQLRSARVERRIPLRELGKRVGVSASFISQVELGQASPSIGTLYSIVSELDLSLDAILGSSTGRPEVPDEVATLPSEDTGEDSASESRPAAPETLVSSGREPYMFGFQPADDRPEINVEGVRWERLTSTDDALTEFLRVTYTPGSESCSKDNLMRHGGWEYIHVLEGRLDVQVLFKTQTLDVGDSLNFDSTAPHRISNPYGTTCVAIWVVVGRNGFHHPLHGVRGGDSAQEIAPTSSLG